MLRLVDLNVSSFADKRKQNEKNRVKILRIFFAKKNVANCYLFIIIINF